MVYIFWNLWSEVYSTVSFARPWALRGVGIAESFGDEVTHSLVVFIALFLVFASHSIVFSEVTESIDINIGLHSSNLVLTSSHLELISSYLVLITSHLVLHFSCVTLSRTRRQSTVRPVRSTHSDRHYLGRETKKKKKQWKLKESNIKDHGREKWKKKSRTV